MVDAVYNRYIGGGPKRLSRSEIEKMRKSMRKIPEIQLKSDVYHQKEVAQIEKILGQIGTEEARQITNRQDERNYSQQSHSLWSKIINRIKRHFIS